MELVTTQGVEGDCKFLITKKPKKTKLGKLFSDRPHAVDSPRNSRQFALSKLVCGALR